ncbi:conserved membrane protein of unknown function(Lysylphosphatidylglycerol synthetase/glycosyltransferase AglD,15-295) [Magnetospirillum sp. XM-1]|uniref:lysylphosphatidylglycerol synthase transmembrane domain-containing protein n=1 Tax=Magnetospirillum sp. XM-1 TaxID=1663591 RepID=UPI00073DCEE8|nr:lysylphosphatidylglycerol synthase transmembrane domain-containing protein [Magnetospirillum sp. XM-1]CUW38714.1 conserved membrane protein of unknown function(Lysylphosphatidylglycerol synthetase/glycosyltransferase AglD,15-295) [Magnetospirillum sp. XM-1]
MVKRWLPWVLKGGLSVALIWFAFRNIDLAEAWSRAKTIDPVMLCAALALGIAQVVIGAGRWWLVLRALKSTFSAIQALPVFYIGVCFSIVTPVLGDAVRMWKAHHSGLSLKTSVNSVMLERLVTILGLVLLVAAMEPLLLARVPDVPGTWVFPLLSVIGVAGLVFISQLDRLPASLHRWRVVRGLVHLAGDTRLLARRVPYGAGTLAVAIFGHANLALIVYILAVGLKINVSLLDCLILFPPVILALTLPISIAGFGLRENIMIVAFGWVGVEASSAAVLGLMYGLISIVTALPGGLIWLMSGDHPNLEEIEHIEEEAEIEAEKDGIAG